MKTNLKRIISILLAVMVMASFTVVVLADNDIGITSDRKGAQSAFGGTANKVIGFVQFVGYAIAIGMLIYLGIKYVTSSANEKADLKKGSVNYVIGAILIVAAVTIFGMLAGFANDTISDNGGTGEGTQTNATTTTK